MPNVEEELRLHQLLYPHEDWHETLKEALKVEKEEEERYQTAGYGKYPGWEWYAVHTPAPTLNKMVTEKILDITLSTRSGTHFKVREPELVEKLIKQLEEPSLQPPPSSMPEDLLSTIVGHDNIKTIVKYAIDAEKAVHLLFSGPPASAKTLFLMELARLPESYYCLAQTTSQAGLANLLFTYQPRYLLIDEIDRLTGEHVGVLNSLMATGIISESKFGKTRRMNLPTKVFAAGIKIHTLPTDLLSRFTQLKFAAYTEEEFGWVAVRVLTTMENTSAELAGAIAKGVWNRSQTASDVRQCVQLARLSGGDPAKAVEILRVLKGQRLPLLEIGQGRP